MNNSMWTTFKQAFLETDKGSMKAVSAFMTMLLIAFLTVYPTVKDLEIDHAMILELIGFVCVLYGIKGWQAVSMNKKETSTTPTTPAP